MILWLLESVKTCLICSIPGSEDNIPPFVLSKTSATWCPCLLASCAASQHLEITSRNASLFRKSESKSIASRPNLKRSASHKVYGVDIKIRTLHPNDRPTLETRPRWPFLSKYLRYQVIKNTDHPIRCCQVSRLENPQLTTFRTWNKSEGYVKGVPSYCC